MNIVYVTINTTTEEFAFTKSFFGKYVHHHINILYGGTCKIPVYVLLASLLTEVLGSYLCVCLLVCVHMRVCVCMVSCLSSNLSSFLLFLNFVPFYIFHRCYWNTMFVQELDKKYCLGLLVYLFCHMIVLVLFEALFWSQT